MMGLGKSVKTVIKGLIASNFTLNHSWYISHTMHVYIHTYIHVLGSNPRYRLWGCLFKNVRLWQLIGTGQIEIYVVFFFWVGLY
jgi:hypothetical protein